MFAAQCPTGIAKAQGEALQRIDGIAAQLEQWRQGCPESFAHLQQVVAAEQARIAGEL